MKVYEKRNMNKGIREEYEKKQKQQKTTNTKVYGDEKKKDVYRQNYRHQAGKDVKQINAHGDPLLQEYVYHDGERIKAVVGQDREIYT